MTSAGPVCDGLSAPISSATARQDVVVLYPHALEGRVLSEISGYGSAAQNAAPGGRADGSIRPRTKSLEISVVSYGASTDGKHTSGINRRGPIVRYRRNSLRLGDRETCESSPRMFGESLVRNKVLYTPARIACGKEPVLVEARAQDC